MRKVYILAVLIALQCLLTCQADEKQILALQGDVACYVEAGKLGFMCSDGSLLTDALYDGAQVFIGGYAVVYRGELCGVVNRSGIEILPCEFEDVTVEAGVFVVKKDGQYGICGTDGKIILEPQYDDFYCVDDYAVVSKDALSGMINMDGRTVIPYAWYDVGFLHDGWAVVTDENHQSNYINLQGQMLLKTWAYSCNDFSGGYASIYPQDDNECYLVDAKGRKYSETVYEAIDLFPDDGIFTVLKNGKWGFVNTRTGFESTCIWDDMHGFSEGYAAVKESNQWGYIDTQGNMAIDCQYYWAYDFNEGFASVEISKGKYTFIDIEGKRVSNDTYTLVQPFSEGIAVVQREGVSSWRFINTQGEFVFPDMMPWDNVTGFDNGYCIVYMAGTSLINIINHQGELVCYFKYPVMKSLLYRYLLFSERCPQNALICWLTYTCT